MGLEYRQMMKIKQQICVWRQTSYTEQITCEILHNFFISCMCNIDHMYKKHYARGTFLSNRSIDHWDSYL